MTVLQFCTIYLIFTCSLQSAASATRIHRITQQHKIADNCENQNQNNAIHWARKHRPGLQIPLKKLINKNQRDLYLRLHQPRGVDKGQHALFNILLYNISLGFVFVWAFFMKFRWFRAQRRAPNYAVLVYQPTMPDIYDAVVVFMLMWSMQKKP